jgi:hypothetical protein
MWKFSRKQRPINVDELALRHFTIAFNAHVQAGQAEELGLVAAPHVRRTATKHALISQRLDALLKSNESAAVEDDK